MRIINSHVHMIEPDRFFESGVRLVPNGIPVYKDMQASFGFLRPESVISQMDEAGIDKSVLFAVDAPILYASNQYVKSLCDRYPDRFIGFASLNPKSTDATTVLEHAVDELGLRGLKLHPPLQDFFPNDETVFPVYEKAAQLDIPVVFHVGTTPFGNRCKLSQANPLLIDDVANNFPELRIMLTHLGTLWHNESFMIVEKHPNVYIDTAAYLYEIPRLLDVNLVKRLGANKVVFGTDYPSPFADEPHCMKDFVDCITSLGFSRSLLEDIFFDNINSFLSNKRDNKKGE
jgi:uncharacterized protein